MKTQKNNHQAGFTLIEFIVALVIAAIAASMVYTYFGSALTQSSAPIERLKQVSKNLQKVMENMILDYNRLNQFNLRYKWRSGRPYQEGEIVIPSDSTDNVNSKVANNGRYYISTTAGDSGNTLPTWPVTANPGLAGGTVTEGTVVWREQGYVWQANTTYAPNTIIVPVITNGHYYICTTGGTSGLTEPTRAAWLPSTVPTTPWTITNGTVTWTEAGTILQKNAATPSTTFTNDNFYTRLPDINATNTRYGTGYKVTEKVFVRFDPTSTPPNRETTTGVTEKNILKVTIKNDTSAETLTQYFTIR